MLNTALFVIFPYVSVVLAVVVGIYRYRADRFSYSSFSSQFLEKETLFWGSAPWHYGILLILLAHLLAALFPGAWAALLAEPTRLYVLETTGLALAVLTLWGLLALIARRMNNSRVAAVTTPLDWLLLVALLAQVALGLVVALFYRWGANWYLDTAVPWLASLIKLTPKTEAVATLPWVVQAHMLGGFVIVLLFPFTRLVHVVSLPLSYLWRPYQVFVWNRPKRVAERERR